MSLPLMLPIDLLRCRQTARQVRERAPFALRRWATIDKLYLAARDDRREESTGLYFVDVATNRLGTADRIRDLLGGGGKGAEPGTDVERSRAARARRCADTLGGRRRLASGRRGAMVGIETRRSRTAELGERPRQGPLGKAARLVADPAFGVDLREDSHRPPPGIRIHRQEVDDVGPVLADLVKGRWSRGRTVRPPHRRRSSPACLKGPCDRWPALSRAPAQACRLSLWPVRT
jgi:hypothetical protein